MTLPVALIQVYNSRREMGNHNFESIRATSICKDLVRVKSNNHDGPVLEPIGLEVLSDKATFKCEERVGVKSLSSM